MSFVAAYHFFDPELIQDSHTEFSYHVSLVSFYLYLFPFLIILSQMIMTFLLKNLGLLSYKISYNFDLFEYFLTNRLSLDIFLRIK